MKTKLAVGLAMIGTALCAFQASANLVNLGPGSFTPLAPEITFSEVALGTVNPVYPNLPAGSLGAVTVSFAGSFVGQTVTGGFPVTLNPSQPTGPLALNYAPGADTVTVNDGAPGATSPVLSGSPTFNGPISVLFSQPVAAVGLKGGYFDALGATTIQAYDANGNILGSIVNSQLGFQFYGLADSSGNNVIKGISFFITGNEPAGFEIDNLTFGAKEVVTGLPDGGLTAMLLGFGLTGLGLLRRKLS